MLKKLANMDTFFQSICPLAQLVASTVAYLVQKSIDWERCQP